MSEILVTGAQSGIGKYICEQLTGTPLTRENHQIINERHFDTIIHCANNRNKFPNSFELYQYYLDNIQLTEKLVSCDHKTFIYLSTIEVYPYRPKIIWRENDKIPVSDLQGIYPYSKLISEKIVENAADTSVILRLSSLLGKYTRHNTTRRILLKEKGPFSLSADSEFNFVSYEDVLGFIDKATDSSMRGTFNVVSSKNISLRKIASIANTEPVFGNYKYVTGNIANETIVQYEDAFAKTSEDIVRQYLKELI